MSGPALLVLAAGMGSRYGGLKQMDAVGPGGEAIVDYSIYDALRAGFRRVVFVVRREIEAEFRQKVGARFEHVVDVSYVLQEMEQLPEGFHVPAGRTKPWGTTHAVLAAAGTIDGAFAVINADDFYGAESYRVLADHLKSGAPEYAMVGFVLRNTLSDFGSVARGVCRVSSNGYLERIEELTNIERDGSGAKNTAPDGAVTPLSGDEPVSMNFWGFTPGIFLQLRDVFQRFLERSGSELKTESYVPAAVGELITAGKATVKVLHSADPWFGVTYREDRPRVVDSIRKLVDAGKYPAKLW